MANALTPEPRPLRSRMLEWKGVVPFALVFGGLAGIHLATFDSLLYHGQEHLDVASTLRLMWVELVAATILGMSACLAVSISLLPLQSVLSVRALPQYAGLSLLAGGAVLLGKVEATGFPELLLVGGVALSFLASCVVFSIVSSSHRFRVGTAILAVLIVMCIAGLTTGLFAGSTKDGEWGSVRKLELWVHALALPGIVVWVLWEFSKETSSLFRRSFVAAIPILVLSALSASTWFTSKPHSTKLDRPNVILVTLDAMRRDHVSLYGHGARTPNIDSFFGSATIFGDAHSVSGWTLPAMTAMFSERYPGITPSRHLGANHVPEEVVTFAETARAKGYVTAGFCGNWALSASRGILQGFDESLVLNHHRRGDEIWDAPPVFHNIYNRLRRAIQPDRKFVDTTPILIDRAERFIETYQQDTFFLWLHLMSPHDPYNPDPDTLNDDYDGPLSANHFAPHDEFPSEFDIREGRFQLSEKDEDHIGYLYRKEVEELDRFLGGFFETLENEGTLDQTIVVLTSDHGEELWDHGDYYHGHSLYQELTSIPLLFRIPGQGSSTVDGLATLIDVFPTLRSFCGLSVEPDAEGQSLRAAIESGEVEERTILAMEHEEHLYAARDLDYSFIWNSLSGEIQLFDRKTDPLEMQDIVTERPDLVQRYLSLVGEYRDGIMARSVSTDPKKDGQLMERLKSIGYIQ